MEKKLQVKDLRISFRTTDGKVQAVRGINFDLYKGETLAIVGESGSGKSVTSKAILGILAGNAIVENGEIIYDGKDLIKIPEDEFHKIRGDKIAMIFQDPMSSLNPIIRIGRQLTEAMILKGKVRQKESRATFNRYLKNLQECMDAANGDDKTADAVLAAKCRKFDKFEYKHLELEGSYNKAHDAATEAVGMIEELSFELSKKVSKDLDYRIKRIAKLSRESIERYVVHEKASELTALIHALKNRADISAAKKGEGEATITTLNAIGAILSEALTYEMPNFFAMGYYLTYSGQELPEMGVKELNACLRKYLDDNFMLDFIENARMGLKWSADKSYAAKAEAIRVLNEQKAVFTKDALDRKECKAAHKVMTKAVEASIDKMEIVKDSISYTFSSALDNEIEKYFGAIVKNEKEEKRFAKQTARRTALVAKGKEPEWQVAPKSLIDMDEAKAAVIHQVDLVVEHFEQSIAARDKRSFDDEAVGMIDFLKENASGVVKKVTKGIAKERAIKLMEEVGIPEPRKRFTQYPFEFSGGMRQRIVIAIALAADPDILICDEPTTALDVTIQSQILELINKLKRERNLSVIFITHNLGVVANMADRIAVMYAGKIVEYGNAREVFYEPAHPYTWALLSSMPDLDTKEKLEAIPGTPPDMIYPPKGDAFAERNKYALKIDFELQPPMFKITDTHYAATWLLHPDAPKVEMPKVITERIARMKSKRGEKDAE